MKNKMKKGIEKEKQSSRKQTEEHDDKLSVVVAAYNVENYISKCFDSILKQTYSNLEVIVVDDGSADGTLKVCDAYSKKDKRIKVIHQDNQGVSAARNLGLSTASGSFVTFLDADDFIHEQMYEKLINAIKTNNADIAMCGYQHAYENSDEVKVINEVNLKKLEQEKIYEYLLKVGQSENKGEVKTDNIIGSVCRAVYSKEILKGIKFEYIPICEDMAFIIDVFDKNPKISVVDEPLYNYLQRQSSVVHTYNDKKIKNKILAYNIVSERIKNKVSNESFKAYQFHTYASIVNEVLKNADRKKLSEILKIDNFDKLNNRENYKYALKSTNLIKYKVAYWFIYHKWFRLYSIIVKIL